MRTPPSRPQTAKRDKIEETPLAMRQRQVRSWLILGMGAVGVVGAIAKWATSARQGAAQVSRNGNLSPNSLSPAALSQAEGTGTPVPLQEMPASAAPTNDARTALAAPVAASTLPEIYPNTTAPLPAAGAKKTKTSRAAKTDSTAKEAASTASTSAAPSGSRKRGKMSEEYDQALQANSLPTDGREGERLHQDMESNPMTIKGSANVASTPVNPAQAGSEQPGSAAPSTAAGGAAEQALSTQAEGKMAVGEELRDREFPVPPQESGAASQRLVVDQETMHDGGPRQGGAIGTVSGDHQNKGDVGDIEDQAAKTPDFAQQR